GPPFGRKGDGPIPATGCVSVRSGRGRFGERPGASAGADRPGAAGDRELGSGAERVPGEPAGERSRDRGARRHGDGPPDPARRGGYGARVGGGREGGGERSALADRAHGTSAGADPGWVPRGGGGGAADRPAARSR